MTVYTAMRGHDEWHSQILADMTQTLTLILWDATSENDTKKTSEQRKFAKSMRDWRNRTLRLKHDCTPIQFSAWRSRNTTPEHIGKLKAMIDEFNKKMEANGLESHMFVVTVGASEQGFASFRHLEMSYILGRLAEIQEVMDAAIKNTRFRRQAKTKYEQVLSDIRDVLENDFTKDFKNHAEAIRRLEGAESTYFDACAYVEQTEADIKAKLDPRAA